MLSVSYNNLTTLPSSITKLPILHRLYIDHNELYSVPDNWYELDVLDASYNHISSLPPASTYSSYNSLSILHLDYNSLRVIPASFADLRYLESLTVSHNSIRTMSRVGSSYMDYIDVSYNSITRLPSIYSGVWYLDASHNNITFAGGKNNLSIRSLLSLNLGSNLIDDIDLTGCRRLIIANLSDNCLDCSEASSKVPYNITYFLCDNVSIDNNSRCSEIWMLRSLASSVTGVTIAFNAFLLLSLIGSCCLMTFVPKGGSDIKYSSVK